MPLPHRDKDELRKAMRAQRRDYAASLDPGARGALETALAEALATLYASSKTAAFYYPMSDEISPMRAKERAAEAGLAIAFPCFVDRDSRMTFRAGTPINPGPWGILQPDADSAIVFPDLILMPLVAVDGRGNRIGMGKGHYDRALPGLRDAGARLIGVGWEFQRLADPLTPDDWDIPLDGFASPAGLETFR